eukprot:m.453518 g.453518  ORF g.453518 m.453518 type:complete len:73 (-) comp20514_c0_seq1:1689-1907(-)
MRRMQTWLLSAAWLVLRGAAMSVDEPWPEDMTHQELRAILASTTLGDTQVPIRMCLPSLPGSNGFLHDTILT